MRNRLAPYFQQTHGTALREPVEGVVVPEPSGSGERPVERLLHKTQSAVVNHPAVGIAVAFACGALLRWLVQRR